MSSLIGKQLAGRYLLQEQIARGGMATVYLGHDEKLDRQVAIKVIHPHLSDDPIFRDKFFREARMLAKVNHSNLVNIYDQGDDNGNAFIVLELVKGITLRQAISDFGKLETEQIVQVSKAILSALAQAHERGVVHRDLKPENVLLADDGRIKVTDFGLARELTADTDTGSLVGTIAYLAPEVIRRGKTEKASDIYSFGIMLYEMLTGAQPYRGDDAMQIAFMHTSQRVPSAATNNRAVDENLDQLMIWCTEPLVQDRPEHAQEVLDWLNEVEFEETDLAQTLLLPAETNLTEVIGDVEQMEEPFKKFKARSGVFRWVVASILAITIGGYGGWWYGSGPGALVPIPNVADTNQAQAREQLTEITDSVTIKEIYSESFTVGTVVGTEPGVGILVPRNTSITILVSKGKELVAVPNVIGLDLVTASAQIISSRLTVGKVSEWFNSEYPLGTVYSYSNKNSKIPVTSPVDVKVSLGSIPVVAGLQSSVAKAALEAAGLVVRKITFKYSTTIPKGEVLSVTPDEPEVGKGSSVKLVVSKGPATVTMPVVKGETILAAKALLESLGLKVEIDTKWLKKDYGIKRVTGASEVAGTKIKVGQTVTIRSR